MGEWGSEVGGLGGRRGGRVERWERRRVGGHERKAVSTLFEDCWILWAAIRSS